MSRSFTTSAILREIVTRMKYLEGINGDEYMSWYIPRVVHHDSP